MKGEPQSHSDAMLLVTAADDNYSMPLAAMLRSVTANVPADRSAVIRVIDGGISAGNKARLVESCATDNCVIEWIPARELPEKRTPAGGRLGPLTYQRLLLPELLDADAERVLYLDSDMIIDHDLGELWDMPLSKPVAAVQDQAVPYVSSPLGLKLYRRFGIPADQQYFNAGVLLIDLERWRTLEVSRRCFEYLEKHGSEINCYDQDGLNFVLGGDWQPLDPRWNQIASVAGRWLLAAPMLRSQHSREMARDPWIIHYAGYFKPWKDSYRGRYRKRFEHYLDQTLWAGARPKSDWKHTLLAGYDRILRPLAYPLEVHYLRWSHRL